MKKIILFLLIIFSINSFSQSDWVNYIVKKEKGLMTISIDLDYNDSKPNYKNLLIVGTNYKDCLKNGFPKKEGLNKLYTFSDSIARSLDRITKNKLVGIITYQCIGLDIYYVKDTLNIRDNFNELFKNNFHDSKNYMMIVKDKYWGYYFKNIYPFDVSNDYFMDQELLIELANEGDQLTGVRKIEHWVYHNNTKKREKFIKNIKKLDFSIDSIYPKKDQIYQYEMLISRKDSVSPQSINRLTRLIKTLVYASNGVYGGWSMEPKTEGY